MSEAKHTPGPWHKPPRTDAIYAGGECIAGCNSRISPPSNHFSPENPDGVDLGREYEQPYFALHPEGTTAIGS